MLSYTRTIEFGGWLLNCFDDVGVDAVPIVWLTQLCDCCCPHCVAAPTVWLPRCSASVAVPAIHWTFYTVVPVDAEVDEAGSAPDGSCFRCTIALTALTAGVGGARFKEKQLYMMQC